MSVKDATLQLRMIYVFTYIHSIIYTFNVCFHTWLYRILQYIGICNIYDASNRQCSYEIFILIIYYISIYNIDILSDHQILIPYVYICMYGKRKVHLTYIYTLNNKRSINIRQILVELDSTVYVMFVNICRMCVLEYDLCILI